MTINYIPPAYNYICQRCGDIHRQENATGHYADSTPPEWMTITIIDNSNPEGRARRVILLCEKCTELAKVHMQQLMIKEEWWT